MGSLEGVFALVMLEMNEALGIYRWMEYQVGVVGVGPYSLVWMNLRVLVGLRALRVDQEHSKKEIGLFPMSKIEYVGTYRWMSPWLVSSKLLKLTEMPLLMTWNSSLMEGNLVILFQTM